MTLELSENDIQRAIFQHLRERGAPGIFAFHPKNGSSDMAGRKAGIYQALGVEPGVPDVIVIKGQFADIGVNKTAQLCAVFALELKRENRRGKKMTPHEETQLDTRLSMTECGVTCGIAYGLDEALTWLERKGLLIGNSAARRASA